MKTKDLVEFVVSILDEKKAEDILVLDLKDQGAIVDYMIIASGTSSRHVHTLADFTTHELKQRGVKTHVEGLSVCDWALIDTGDVLIHVFKPEAREFSNLEKMWGHHFSKTNG